MIRNLVLATGISAAVALGALGAHDSTAATHASTAATVASAVIAQARPQPAAQVETPAQAPARSQATPGLGDQKQVEGKIKSVGPSAQSIIFEDGTTLVVPDSLAIRRSELKPGATIRAQYEERDGQKVITTITVHPPSLVR